jgi:hypothetical protein
MASNAKILEYIFIISEIFHRGHYNKNKNKVDIITGQIANGNICQNKLKVLITIPEVASS